MSEPPSEIRALVQKGPVVPFLAIKQSSFQLILNGIGQNLVESASQVDGKAGFQLSGSRGLFIMHGERGAAIFKPQNTIFRFIFRQESCESAAFDLSIEHAVICDRGGRRRGNRGVFSIHRAAKRRVETCDRLEPWDALALGPLRNPVCGNAEQARPELCACPV